jgi:hypothetical protein
MTDETKQVHHADCGDVGETGEHGELGSNAAGAAREAAPEPTIQAKPSVTGSLIANPLVTHISR